MKLYYEKGELAAATTLSESTIDEDIRQERFPKPRQLTANKFAWLYSDLEEWMRIRPVAEPERVSRERTELYRHFGDDGRLLYVGISLSTVARLSQHMNSSHWSGTIATISIERFDTRDEALAAELKAIREEAPLYNIAGVANA